MRRRLYAELDLTRRGGILCLWPRLAVGIAAASSLYRADDLLEYQELYQLARLPLHKGLSFGDGITPLSRDSVRWIDIAHSCPGQTGAEERGGSGAPVPGCDTQTACACAYMLTPTGQDLVALGNSPFKFRHGAAPASG